MAIKDRIKELRRIKASELRHNPNNWRKHPLAQQSAILGLLQEVGYVDALLVRELPDGACEIVDGHLRADTTPDMLVPVLVLDINDEESAKVLATFNPVAEMGEADPEKLDKLLQQVDAETEAVRKLLEDLALEHGLAEGSEPVELTRIDTSKPPPKMAWVLLGIPVTRFGEIAERVESIAMTEGLVLHTTVNDGEKKPKPKKVRRR